VAAFFPLLFWPGIMGDFMKYLPITVIITLSSSLFVALVVSPTVCSLWGRADTKRAVGDHWFVRLYTRLLAKAVDYRVVTLALAVLVLAGLGWVYSRANLGVDLFPDIDPDRALINIRNPQGTNIHESDSLAREVERRVAPFRAQYDHLITNVGSSSNDMGVFTGMGSGPHVANLTLVFKDYEVREEPSADVVKEIRGKLSDIPGAEIKVAKEEEGPPTGAAVTVRIIGRDFQTLAELSEKARQMIATVPGLVNLRSDLEVTRPELAFQVDRRRAMLLGVNTAVIGNFLKMAIFGREVGTYRQFNDEYDITVRLPLEKRVNIEDIFTLRVPNAVGRAVPLSSLGEFQYQGGYGTVTRINRKRVVTLTGDSEGRLDTAVLKDVQDRLKKLSLPAGYRIEYAGKREEQQEATAFLSKAFIVAVLIITMILVTQFNSLKVPLIIMSTVVLSMGGVLVGLLALRIPFIIVMTGIGVISLAGVVVNNAIVLLAYARQLRARGLELTEAAIEAGRTRLRPVLLTATTTILGLIPMVTGISYDFHTFHWVTRSQSSEWWRSMATAVIFGLGFATMLTLVVVPCLYVALGGLKTTDSQGPLAEPASPAALE
jgi:multidrug efflux pump subunit AcrB